MPGRTFRFSFGTNPDMKKMWKGMGLDPQILRLLEKQFTEPLKQMEKLFRQNSQGWNFRINPQFSFPNGNGKMGGTFRVQGFRNGKRYTQVYRFKNGKWELENGKSGRTTRPRTTRPRTLPRTAPRPSSGLDELRQALGRLRALLGGRNVPNPQSLNRNMGPKLGVRVQTLSSYLKRPYKSNEHGVIVIQVTPYSRAQKAGLRNYDVITHVNGTPIKTVQDLQNIVIRTGKGAMTLKVKRQKQNLIINVDALGVKKKITPKNDKKNPKRRFF